MPVNASSTIRPTQKGLEAPVLFLVFNRPDSTRRVFSAIRAARPKRLYVAADGPRSDRQTDREKVAEVREIATAVDWDCELKTLFRSNNLGCGRAPSQGITWFLQNEEMGIILEDDCLPHTDFWSLCDELLQRYRDDQRVMAIAGSNFSKNRRCTSDSYYFSRHYHFWGWATWARAWRHFDYDMRLWPAVKQADLVESLCMGEQEVANYWRRKWDQVSQGLIDAWDYQWTFTCWLHNGLQIIPAVNLVSNIGFDHQATHTTNSNSACAALPTHPIGSPLTHPPVVLRNMRADQCFAQEWLVSSLSGRVVRRIRRIADRLSAGGNPQRKRIR